MERHLGKLWPVSVPSLGGGGLGQVWGEITFAECVATAEAAVVVGVDLFDPAPRYSDRTVERVVGAAFAGRPPNGVHVTSKCNLGELPAAEIEPTLRRSIAGSPRAAAPRLPRYVLLIFERRARFGPPFATTRRGGLMIVGLIAFLLCCPLVLAAPPSHAAEPARAGSGATIVLQLPPSMPPEAVRAILAELAAKGARPGAVSPDPPPAATIAPAKGQAMTRASLAATVWTASGQAFAALPRLAEVPRRWGELAVAGGASRHAAVAFWIVALVGILAVPLVGIAVRRVFDRRWQVVVEPGLGPRLQVAGVRVVVAVASLVAYALVYWAALWFLSSGAPIMEEAADHLVLAAVKWRLLMIALVTVVSPYRADLRLLAIEDADAFTCWRWITVYLAINPLVVFLIWFVERLGFDHAAVYGLAFVTGLAATLYKIAMFWAIRRPIGRAIRAATIGEPNLCRRTLADYWHWLFVALALAVFVGAAIEFALGRGSSATSASAATQVIVVALAVAWQAGHKLIAHLFEADGKAAAVADPALALRRANFSRVLLRLYNALLGIFGAAWLAQTWGLDLVGPPPGGIERMVVRPAVEAAATIIGAWILWTALSAVIDEKMPHAIGPDDEDGPNAGSVSRVGTLLPLIRNVVLISLAAIALIVALSTLGLNIAPLLAGLGVIGIAVGFGAQSLVRDVISGIFFLMEDAFRVGEYIDTGRLRGTVEGMSLRSVRLRHQNGQIHTIPFGQILAVTNFSRDWSVVKFNLHLEPAADIETVRRTIKRVGEALLEDTEVGGEFIQPLKMQGVVDVMQHTLVVRCKFTATPGRPTYLQRLALRRLIEAFGGAGVHFAAPSVTLQFGAAAAGG
jgi:moderate conductance mechanosensitive channel